MYNVPLRAEASAETREACRSASSLNEHVFVAGLLFTITQLSKFHLLKRDKSTVFWVLLGY